MTRILSADQQPPLDLALRDWSHWHRDVVVDLQSGLIVRRQARSSKLVAGFARVQLGDLPVLVYKVVNDDGDSRLIVQKGSTKFSITEGICRPTERSSFMGLRRKLVLACGDDVLTLREFTLKPFVLKRIDPTFDQLDEWAADFIGWTRELVENRERQKHLLQVWVSVAEKAVSQRGIKA